PLPITEPDSLLDIDVPIPVPSGRDLLVSVKAVSVNPVDAKLRGGNKSAESVHAEDGYRILGFDAAGVVEAAGPDVTLFKPGNDRSAQAACRGFKDG
ncbi:MAG TPA: alcohol dehydrogenase catalytic domain-containing protein, partial [Blastocatellia bacterium]